jgi:ATP-dependent DNA helicase RecG
VQPKITESKIKNNMGITAEVNLQHEGGKHYIEIGVQPYSVPISLRGRYYYRSGSVKQELTGAALNEFLLKRAGFTWDDVIDERATFADIDEASIKKILAKSRNRRSFARCRRTYNRRTFGKTAIS